MAQEVMPAKPYFYPGSDMPAPQILFIQHFNMLCDPRTESWEKAITATVKPHHTVADLGCGTGILSMMASRISSKVYGIEADPCLARYAEEAVKENGLSDRITIINEDAAEVELPEKPHVIICEMLDTGLIKERQVQVMNRVLERLKDPDLITIPSKVTTWLALSKTDFVFSGFNLPLPHFETGEVRKTHEYFSQPVLYHTISLTQKNSTDVRINLNVPANRTGIFNSIKIISMVDLCPDQQCGPSNWFNPPLVLPVPPTEVKTGDVVNVRLSYMLGEGLRSLDYKAEKL